MNMTYEDLNGFYYIKQELKDLEDEPKTKFNCFFYDFKNKNCRILRKLYCENESNCKFFKTCEQYAKEKEKYDY